MQENNRMSDKIGQAVSTWALKNKLQAGILSIFVFLALAAGMKNLTMTTDYRYFFGEDNPQRIAFEQLQNIYSKDDSVLFVIQPKTGSVASKRTLEAIIDLTDKSWKVPYSTRVDSLSNFQHSKATGDDLIVKDLVREEELETLTPENFKEIEFIALNEPLLINRIISKDARTTGINVRVELPGKSPFEVPEVAEYVRGMAREFREKYPDHEIYLSGIAMLNNAFNEAGMNDMMTLTPIMYAVIILIMFIMLRSFWAVVATLIVVFLSMLAGLGFGGWIKIPLSPPSSVAPTVILTLAIADSIHILKTILESMARGMEKKAAIVNSMRINFQPVFLTSLTTVVGFLTLNFSDTPPFHDLGNITAAGVAAAFFFSVVLLPMLIMIFPVKAKIVKNKESQWLPNFGAWIAQRRYPVLIAIFSVSGFLISQIPNIKLNDQFIEYFDRSVEFRSHAEFMMDNLTGMYLVNFDINSDESQGISKPDFLKSVDDFANYMRTLPDVVHVSTITDTFKRLNKNMHGDDQAFYKLPENRELAAQYLLLYEMSLPYGLDLNNQINVDKSSTRIIVTMGNVETQQMLSITEKGESWLKKNTPSFMHAIGSSPAVMFAHITERNVRGMTKGTIIAFILITLTLIVAIGSFKYGLVSLLPNAIPAGLGFGVWSLAVGEAGFAIAIVGSVTLGIVVDDTVHFLSKYVRARREKGYDSVEAIRDAFENVGPALIVTTVVLVCGFSVLMLSPFKMNVVLGALSAMTIGLALIVDFLLLPALLPVIDRSGQNEKQRSQEMKSLAKATLAGVLAVALGLWSNASKAETPEAKGLSIAKKVDATDAGFINQVAEVEMVLKNRQGQESKRKMRIKTLEVSGDGDKSLTIFDSPRDVKGTAFLSFSHATTPDDQWLYLPALKRVKRISSNNKSGPFMGSEFAYEDISSQEVNKYTYKFIANEKLGDLDTVKIERYPVDKNSGYTKQIVWLYEKEWRVEKIEFFDRKGSPLKSLVYEGYKKYSNGKWRPKAMKMVNHQSGKSTTLNWIEYKFNQKISDADFNKNALKRVR